MRYITATVLIGIEDEEYSNFSEGADITFHLAHLLHKPDDCMWLTRHDDYADIPTGMAEDLKHRVITPEGGC